MGALRRQLDALHAVAEQMKDSLERAAGEQDELRSRLQAAEKATRAAEERAEKALASARGATSTEATLATDRTKLGAELERRGLTAVDLYARVVDLEAEREALRAARQATETLAR